MARPDPNRSDDSPTRAGGRRSDEGPTPGDVRRAFAMMDDDSVDTAGPSHSDPVEEDSTPSSSQETPSDIGYSSASSSGFGSGRDTIDEPETGEGGTKDVPSELLRLQAAAGGSDESPSGHPESLPGPAASSERKSSLVDHAADKRRFRPHLRPPTPVLEILDDDLIGSEKLRLRGKSFVIGRSQGDLTLPNDRVMSRRHAEVYVEVGTPVTQSRWMLKDLSTNGTFVRTNEVLIAGRERLWLGGDMVRAEFDRDLGELSLVELKPNDPQRYCFQPGQHWIGVDPAKCVDFMRESPFLDPCAFSVESDAMGRWRLIDHGSVNGLWQAIQAAPVELVDGSEFKLGEQHFLFRLP